MRGHDEQTTHMFSYLSPEQSRAGRPSAPRRLGADGRSPADNVAPIRGACTRTTERPSIPPKQLLRALLLQVLYTVRSERLLMEELNDNLLFRWFVGLNMDDPV